MKKWITEVVHRVNEKAGTDPMYQELFEQCMKEEVKFKRIMKKLTQEEREQVGDYIALCEDLQYRKAQLAYKIGVTDGAK